MKLIIELPAPESQQLRAAAARLRVSPARFAAAILTQPSPSSLMDDRLVVRSIRAQLAAR